MAPLISPDPAGAAATGVLLSGGVDSAVLVGDLLRRGAIVQPFYIRSHLAWEREEQRAVSRFLRSQAGPGLRPLVTLELPLVDLYGQHWSVSGRGVPSDATPDEAVYLPGRNALLVIKAAVWCQLHGVPELALAPLGNNPFPDATDEFFDALSAALSRGGSRPLKILRPFASLSKTEVLARGRELPLELTFSCIAPSEGLHCGRCNKCGERKDAFRNADLEDPTSYAR